MKSNTKSPSILIAVPCMDMMHSRFVQSLIKLKRPINSEIKFCINSLVYDARNTLVREAIKDNYDYVCFIDSDMTFNCDVLERLLAHHTDVVTALYYQRKGLHRPCIFTQADENGATYYESIPNENYFEVQAFGTAFCLIKTSVLVDCVQYTGGCFEPMAHIGEDISFCVRARSVGYKLMCDSTLRLGHIGTYEYNERDYNGQHRS